MCFVPNSGDRIMRRAFTITELLVALLIIILLVSIVFSTFSLMQEETKPILWGSQIHQAKLELFNQQLYSSKKQFSYTDEKGYLWTYNSRDKSVTGSSPNGKVEYRGDIFLSTDNN